MPGERTAPEQAEEWFDSQRQGASLHSQRHVSNNSACLERIHRCMACQVVQVVSIRASEFLINAPSQIESEGEREREGDKQRTKQDKREKERERER